MPDCLLGRHAPLCPRVDGAIRGLDPNLCGHALGSLREPGSERSLAKARKGLIKGVTGVSDVYEEPKKPEVRIETTAIGAKKAVEKMRARLARNGFIDLGDRAPDFSCR